MISKQSPIASGFGAHTTAVQALDGADLTGKIAIVTGGASGLGLATVRRLASEGARVVAIDLPSADQVALKELGDAVVFAPADVTDEAAVQAAVDLANAEGTLAVAVNCAVEAIRREHTLRTQTGRFRSGPRG